MFAPAEKSIIVGDPPVTAEHPIFAEIAALLDDAAEAPLVELEHTLTAGYAAALELEAERLRVERRIGEAATMLGEGAGTAKAHEIAKLARKLSSTDADLSRLRLLLVALREQAAAVRAA